MAYVYILENKVAERIKIGATFNRPDDRLLDINRMWQATKGRCQICLSWRLLANGFMPSHVLNMKHCPGSGKLPLEYSTKLAEEQLQDLQRQLPKLSGSELNFASKRIKNLTKILENYSAHPIRHGTWELRASFKNEEAYVIEGLVHQVLAVHLDKDAPFGEVFIFPAEEAIKVVENTLAQLEQNL